MSAHSGVPEAGATSTTSPLRSAAGTRSPLHPTTAHTSLAPSAFMCSLLLNTRTYSHRQMTNILIFVLHQSPHTSRLSAMHVLHGPSACETAENFDLLSLRMHHFLIGSCINCEGGLRPYLAQAPLCMFCKFSSLLRSCEGAKHAMHGHRKAKADVSESFNF